MNYFEIYFISNALELPVYLFFLRKEQKWTVVEKIAFITGLNAITHPIVFFGIMNLKFSFLINILVAEFFAIITEGMVLSRLMGKIPAQGIALSFLANSVSWQLGPVITFSLLKP